MSDDIHALSGAYAVDALDDVERARFVRHLVTCHDCQVEVASLQETAAALASLTEVEAPRTLRDKVMRDITAVRPLPPEQPAGTSATREVPPMRADRAPDGRRDRPDRPGRWRPRRWRAVVAAAAAAAVLAVGGFAVWRSLDQGTPPPTVAEQVLDAPDAARITQSLADGATASIVRSTSLHRAVLVTERMPAAPAGKVYQLWLQDPSGHLSPAGLMPAGRDQVVLLDGDASTATGAGITVEPAGGSPQPTSTPIALFAFT